MSNKTIRAASDEDGDHEEEFIANDGADDGHLFAGRGQNAVFGEFVQAGDDELSGDQEKNGGSDAEEFLQVDLDAALDEHHTEENGDDDSGKRADEAHQFGRVQGDGGQQKNGFGALAQNHQEDEQEEADPRVAASQKAELAFDFALHFASRLHHEDDHGDDEDGGDEHDPAFEDVFVKLETRENDGDADGSDKGGGRGQRRRTCEDRCVRSWRDRRG